MRGALAHGGLGWIYLAVDRNVDDRWVVLKGVLDANDPAALAAARAERQFLAQLSHPNIVAIHNFVRHVENDDMGREHTADYIVMAYIGGSTLAQVRDARADQGVLPVAHALTYMIKVLPALGYLHAEGHVYSDFKPDNVMQCERHLTLIDMGAVARVDDADAVVYGTVGYHAPEVVRAELSPASDLYTVGRTLAVLALGIEPARGGVATELPDDHPLLLRHESLHRLLLRATHPDPLYRFGSADEMAEQLDGVRREVLAVDEQRPRPAPSAVFSAPRGTFAPGLLLPDSETETGPGRPVAALIAGRLPEPLDAGEAGHTDTAGQDDWRHRWSAALAALAAGDLDTARAAFDALYSTFPGELAPKLALAAVAECAADDDSAQRYYRLVAAVDPSWADAAFGLARTRLRAGRRADAVAALLARADQLQRPCRRPACGGRGHPAPPRHRLGRRRRAARGRGAAGAARPGPADHAAHAGRRARRGRRAGRRRFRGAGAGLRLGGTRTAARAGTQPARAGPADPGPGGEDHARRPGQHRAPADAAVTGAPTPVVPGAPAVPCPRCGTPPVAVTASARCAARTCARRAGRPDHRERVRAAGTRLPRTTTAGAPPAGCADRFSAGPTPGTTWRSAWTAARRSASAGTSAPATRTPSRWAGSDPAPPTSPGGWPRSSATACRPRGRPNSPHGRPPTPRSPSSCAGRGVRSAVTAAAAAAAALVPRGTPEPPSCTLVCAVHDVPAGRLTVGWVGDSRAYWLAEPGAAEPARLLSADHTAEAAAAAGTLDPAVAAIRPDAITRWLGADGDAEPEVVALTPGGPGALLLCTDGLWKYLPDAAALAAVALPALSLGGAPAAAAALTAAALTAGGADNVTVAVLPVLLPEGGAMTAEFTVQTDQNPYLAPGATRVDAVITVTATGTDATPADALEIIIVDVSGSMGRQEDPLRPAGVRGGDRGAARRRGVRGDRRRPPGAAGLPGRRAPPGRTSGPAPRPRETRRRAARPTAAPRSAPGCTRPACSPTSTRTRSGTRSC